MKHLIFLLPVLLVSCITREKCMERYPPETSVRDSVYIKDSVFVFHDTINVPGETVTVRLNIPCPELNMEKVFKKNGTTARLVIKDGVATCEARADSLQRILESRSRVIEKGRSTSKKEVHHITDWYVPWWIHFVYGTALAIAFWLGRKSKIKFL